MSIFSMVRTAMAVLFCSGAALAGPLDMATGHPVTEVQVNGQGPFPFVVDTAASMTAIFPLLREKLTLTPASQPSDPLHGASGSAAVQLYRLDNVEVDGHRRDALSAVGLSTIDKLPTAAGILGADVLSSHVVDFNIPAGEFRLHCAEDDLAASGRWTILPFKRHTVGFPLIDGTLDGKQITLLLDTGAARTIINGAAAKALGIDASTPGIKPSKPVRGATAHAQSSLEGKFKKISAANWSIDAGTITIADLPVFKALGVADKPMMILGIDKLNGSRFVVDYPRNRLLIAEGATSHPLVAR